MITKLKTILAMLAFLLLAIVILVAGYLCYQATQPGGPAVIRSAREGVTLAVATPERWER